MRLGPRIVWMLSLLSLSSAVAAGECPGCDGKPSADPMCGPKSLLVICQRLGVDATLDELAGLSGKDERGTTLAGLSKAVEAKGLHAVGMKISLDELVEAKALAVAYLWGSHFVAIECDGSDGIKVTGSSGKTVTAKKEDFARAYSGFALLVAKDEKAFPKSEAKGPDLRADAYSWDFGFIEQGDQASHAFVLENKGVEDLVLSKAETSCTSTHASLPEDTLPPTDGIPSVSGRIPPGGKGKLPVAFDSTGREGGQTQTVYVQSNDPISPIIQLQVGGVIKPIRLPVSVRKLDFGTVKKRAGAVKEFSIRDPGDKSLTISEVTSDSLLVRASLTRDDKEGLIYRVKAELQPGAAIGQLNTKLTICSNHPKEPVVEIPVTADVAGDIEMFPSQFFLGLLKKGQGASKTITLSTSADKPLKIEKIDSPFDYVTVKSKSEEKGKKYTITATLKDNAPLGLIKGEVVIHTNNADQPEIKVPLYALIEE